MRVGYWRIGYWETREWDCYDDAPSETLDHWFGILYRRFFIGVTWCTETPYSRKGARW